MDALQIDEVEAALSIVSSTLGVPVKFWRSQPCLLQLVSQCCGRELQPAVLARWKTSWAKSTTVEAMHARTGVLFSESRSRHENGLVWIHLDLAASKTADFSMKACNSLRKKFEDHFAARTLFDSEGGISDAAYFGLAEPHISKFSHGDMTLMGIAAVPIVAAADRGKPVATARLRPVLLAAQRWLAQAKVSVLVLLYAPPTEEELAAAAANAAAAAAAAAAATAAAIASAAADSEHDAAAAVLAADALRQAAIVRADEDCAAAVDRLLPLLQGELERVGNKLYGSENVSNDWLKRRWPTWRDYDTESRSVFQSSQGLWKLGTFLAEQKQRSAPTDGQVAREREPVYVSRTAPELVVVGGDGGGARSPCSSSCCSTNVARQDGATHSISWERSLPRMWGALDSTRCYGK